MKKLTFLALTLVALTACKKEKPEEMVINPPAPTPTPTSLIYVSDVPLNSVVIHNDTLTCDADNNVYEYVRISNTEFESSRIYWKSMQNWTTWNQGAISYFSNDTLYINY